MPQSVAEKLEKRRMDEWEIRSAADSLLRAEEIKADKELMKEVQKELEKRKKALNAVSTKK